MLIGQILLQSIEYSKNSKCIMASLTVLSYQDTCDCKHNSIQFINCSSTLFLEVLLCFFLFNDYG